MTERHPAQRDPHRGVIAGSNPVGSSHRTAIAVRNAVDISRAEEV